MKSKWWIVECDFCDWVWDMSDDWTLKKTYVTFNNKTYCPDCWRKALRRH